MPIVNSERNSDEETYILIDGDASVNSVTLSVTLSGSGEEHFKSFADPDSFNHNIHQKC